MHKLKFTIFIIQDINIYIKWWHKKIPCLQSDPNLSMVSESECLKTMISTLGVSPSIMLGKDFSEYKNEYRLRTDAVWEKYQLKDWFRLTSKVKQPYNLGFLL